MLKIGDFSKLSRISIRMLRHYDELGLIVPQSINSNNNYRYYGEEQLQTGSMTMNMYSMDLCFAFTMLVLDSLQTLKTG